MVTLYNVFTHSCGNGFMVAVRRPKADIPRHQKSVLERIERGAKYRCFRPTADEIRKWEAEVICPRCSVAGVVFDPLP